MKLYSEEQVRKAIELSLLNAKLFIHKGLGDDKYFPTLYEALKNLTPIELPSDEEMAYEVITWNVYNMTPLEAFRHGVNWTKEQIQKQIQKQLLTDIMQADEKDGLYDDNQNK